MEWIDRALKLLKDSLYPVPSELNEIDWKSELSDKSERLAQHISAFANHNYGGMLVYGVNNDGTLFSLDQNEIASDDESIYILKAFILYSVFCLIFIFSSIHTIN